MSVGLWMEEGRRSGLGVGVGWGWGGGGWILRLRVSSVNGDLQIGTVC